jgi:hypothetical protein
MNRTTRLAGIVVLVAAGPVACVDQDQMHPQVAFSPPPAVCSSPAPDGQLCGCVYDVPPGIKYLPDFATLAPVERICSDRIDVSLRKGAPGFPGVTGRFEWFGVDFQGDITVADTGPYGFRLDSDDGARLYIDDTLVLNNDGRHDIQTAEGVMVLSAGRHHIRVPYYNGPGPMALTLEVARPGEDYEILRSDRPL